MTETKYQRQRNNEKYLRTDYYYQKHSEGCREILHGSGLDEIAERIKYTIGIDCSEMLRNL